MTRGHKLIKDAGPNVHPDGIFDCTVEERVQTDLVALLNRRDAWNASQDELEKNTLHPRNHALLQDAEPDKMFHCTAEVVHVSYLYVTDYTARGDLVPIYIALKPKVDLSRIVRIKVENNSKP
ncbi:hypothetical protein C8Q75DRAFT_811783 [Abortiporus biennis]|nr:hypothetical protein C8Q75DRAFT_811783 [Abortiporus biennis]